MMETKTNNEETKVVKPKKFFDVKVVAKVFTSANGGKKYEARYLVYAETKVSAEEAAEREVTKLLEKGHAGKIDKINSNALPTNYYNVISDEK